MSMFFWRFAGSHVFENPWIMETLSVLVQVVSSMLKVRFGEDSQAGYLFHKPDGSI